MKFGPSLQHIILNYSFELYILGKINILDFAFRIFSDFGFFSDLWISNFFPAFQKGYQERIQVRHNNTEESMFYYIRKQKHIYFTFLLMILLYLQIHSWVLQHFVAITLIVSGFPEFTECYDRITLLYHSNPRS